MLTDPKTRARKFRRQAKAVFNYLQHFQRTVLALRTPAPLNGALCVKGSQSDGVC